MILPENRRVSPQYFSMLLIVISSLMVNVSNLMVRSIGYALITGSMIILLISAVHSRNLMIDNQLFSLFAPLLIVYAIGAVRAFSINSIKDFLLLLGTILIVIVISKQVFEIFDSLYNIFGKFIPILLMISIAYRFTGKGINVIDGGYKSIYTVTTFFGIFCVILSEYCLLFYLNDHEKKWILYVLFLTAFIYFTKVRTAYIGEILVWVVFLYYGIKGRQLLPVYRMKYVTYILIILFVLIYPILNSFLISDKISMFVYRYTGKIFYSGRQETWKQAFGMIERQPVFGYGLSYTGADGGYMAVHNSFLNLVLQTGFTGLGIVFITINTILKRIEGGGK